MMIKEIYDHFTEACKGPSDDAVVLNVKDKWAREWLDTNDGRKWLDDHGLPAHPQFAPERECRADDPQPVIEFKLTDGQEITDLPLNIKGSAFADKGFKKWRLEYSSASNPGFWTLLTESADPVKNGTLFVWDYSNALEETVTLRLTIIGENAEVEKRVTLKLSIYYPPPPPTVTEEPTPTFLPTETLQPTETFIPTETPWVEIPTETVTPFQ